VCGPEYQLRATAIELLREKARRRARSRRRRRKTTTRRKRRSPRRFVLFFSLLSLSPCLVETIEWCGGVWCVLCGVCV
jgi:hypothetical protein